MKKEDNVLNIKNERVRRIMFRKKARDEEYCCLKAREEK
jgi:hypothetical protein